MSLYGSSGDVKDYLLPCLRLQTETMLTVAPPRSDPFFRLRAGDMRVNSEVVKASLNPVWGDLPDGISSHSKDGFSRKPVQIEVPVFASHVDKQRIELVL